MTTTIMTVIGILLAAAAATMVYFYGGDAFYEGKVKAEAARLTSEGSQIERAIDLYESRYGRAPANAGDSDSVMSEIMGKNFLDKSPEGSSQSSPWVVDYVNKMIRSDLGPEDSADAQKVCRYARRMQKLPNPDMIYQCDGSDYPGGNGFLPKNEICCISQDFGDHGPDGEPAEPEIVPVESTFQGNLYALSGVGFDLPYTYANIPVSNPSPDRIVVIALTHTSYMLKCLQKASVNGVSLNATRVRTGDCQNNISMFWFPYPTGNDVSIRFDYNGSAQGTNMMLQYWVVKGAAPTVISSGINGSDLSTVKGGLTFLSGFHNNDGNSNTVNMVAGVAGASVDSQLSRQRALGPVTYLNLSSGTVKGNGQNVNLSIPEGVSGVKQIIGLSFGPALNGGVVSSN